MLIIVVACTHLDRYEELLWQFGGWPDGKVVLDRREGERRGPSDTSAGAERLREKEGDGRHTRRKMTGTGMGICAGSRLTATSL